MIYLICGQKGTGKSLYTISYLLKNRKKYTKIFSNFPVKFCHQIDHLDWVNFRFPPNSAILIDEAQLYFNSREFSKLTKNGVGMELLDFLTMCRHYKLDIFFITQSSNRIDLQIRELSDYVYYLKRTFKIPFLNRPFLTFGYKFIDIIEFEKYMNPNNFSKEYDFRYLIKFISKKDLLQYDTHFIEQSYYDKSEIDIIDWCAAPEVTGAHRFKLLSLIKVKFKFLFFKIKNLFIILKSNFVKNKEREIMFYK